jgi:lipopolysaccharide transport system ATP-binding protein
MGEVAHQGRTVLFVSHNMGAVKSLCQGCLLITAGAITDSGDTNGVVDRYLQVGAVAASEKKWDDLATAPGDHRVRLQEVSIAPTNPDDNPVTVHTPLSLFVTFRNYESNSLLNISVVVYSLDGTCIFNTASKAEIFDEGIVSGGVKIPGDFLNDGVYTVRVLVVKDTVKCLFDERDTVIFEVHDAERTGMWYGKWIGAVRPQFDWSVEILESNPAFHHEKFVKKPC